MILFRSARRHARLEEALRRVRRAAEVAPVAQPDERRVEVLEVRCAGCGVRGLHPGDLVAIGGEWRCFACGTCARAAES